ncbi:hypothetical protein [Azorhizobium doebereinerae]|uniref:hypothetical protein n=1 Tax=Azorhizobium doebereinerae TaxID=281091 RepID=UPI0004186D42|nr:hypothetical protein [Azorhizobium doebereinerae]
MSEMVLVEERNQDDLSRLAGCYLYTDTRLWLEGRTVHRGEGPAIIGPDGVERWYIHGRHVTRDVSTFFLTRRWSPAKGLDTPEKLAAFQAEFLV